MPLGWVGIALCVVIGFGINLVVAWRCARSWALPVEPHNPNVAWLSVLPYRPILPGLALNIALYGGAAWGILFGPFALRRYLIEIERRQRGCCPACGYDLRGNRQNGCPECGYCRTG